MLTANLIDERIKFARDYEKSNLGIKNGPDFADLAKILMESKEFDGLSLTCSLLTMLPMIARKPENPTERDKEEFAKEMSSGSKEPLALMFYIGYRLGKSENESEQLEKIGKL